MKLRAFIYRRKSLDRWLNQIESKFGADVVIGWGNWSRSSQMKGCIPTPGRSIRRIVARRFETYLIDEFHTSKCCYWCGKEI